MSNGGVCSVKITVDGEKFAYGSNAVFALEGDAIRRIRHRRALKPGAEHLVLVVPGDVPDPLSVAQSVALGLRDSTSPGAIHPSLLPSGVKLGMTDDAPSRHIHLPSGRVLTGEGGWGHKASPLSELRALSMSDRSQDSYYESADQRSARRTALISSIAKSSPEELLDLVINLRSSEKMRTASLMLAVDAALAGAINSRAVLDAAMLRPDDPAVALRYFLDKNPGKPLPASLKKALASAATRLYTENAAMKYDKARRRAVHDRSQTGRPVTFRDVINMTHPKPASDKQSALFNALVSGNIDEASLPHLAAAKRFAKLSPAERLRELEHEAAHARQARADGRSSSTFLSRLSVSDLTALAGQPREDVRAAEAEFAAARAAFDAAMAEHADTRRALRRLETKRGDTRRAIVGLRISLLNESDAVKKATLESDIERLSGKFTYLHDEYSSLAKTPEAKAYKTARQAAKSRVAEAKRNLEASRKAPGVVPLPVWEISVPTMSVSETLSNLGSMGRSGVTGNLRELVTERLLSEEAWSHSSAKMSDLIRTVRGVTLAENASSPAVQDESTDYSRMAGWAALSPSSWEPVFETVAGRIAAEQLPEVRSKVLVLVDCSGSMTTEVSGRRNDIRAEGYHSLSCAEVASFAASTIASRGTGNVDVFTYDTTAQKVDPSALDDGIISASRATSKQFTGGGTDTFKVLQDTWDGHDMVVILTDEQTSWTLDQPPAESYYGGRRIVSSSPKPPVQHDIPRGTRIVTVNLAGYEAAQAAENERFVRLAGFSESLYSEVRRMDEEVMASKA